MPEQRSASLLNKTNMKHPLVFALCHIQVCTSGESRQIKPMKTMSRQPKKEANNCLKPRVTSRTISTHTEMIFMIMIGEFNYMIRIGNNCSLHLEIYCRRRYCIIFQSSLTSYPLYANNI